MALSNSSYNYGKKIDKLQQNKGKRISLKMRANISHRFRC